MLRRLRRTATAEASARATQPNAATRPPPNSEVVGSTGEPPVCCLYRRPWMEHLWSRAVATNGNRWQMGMPRKRQNQAKTIAAGCHWLPIGAHGKEGVDGSSPSEGLKYLQISYFCCLI